MHILLPKIELFSVQVSSSVI